ncbi:membrane protein [Chitiniphilus shinanonensis]|uniref:Membrane protein n=1 Tax=Chitiniphilus shinanonensis TaxID=553088 RepID=A0ABQ6BNC8_9NEIS|nr:DedA family protein [Chitiniphilus shinanonensis]GLS03428.1 membrane protein [Chitiniphilus shinanonensis]
MAWLLDAWVVGLFASAFLSATLLPGNSEAALVAYLFAHPQAFWLPLALATAGNSLGGIVTVWLGTRLPAGSVPRRAEWLARHGELALALSWVPLLGDALCLAAGWLRWPWRRVLPWLILGKFVRYLALAVSVRGLWD